jgi:hypothetical protein
MTQPGGGPPDETPEERKARENTERKRANWKESSRLYRLRHPQRSRDSHRVSEQKRRDNDEKGAQIRINNKRTYHERKDKRLKEAREQQAAGQAVPGPSRTAGGEAAPGSSSNADPGRFWQGPESMEWANHPGYQAQLAQLTKQVTENTRLAAERERALAAERERAAERAAERAKNAERYKGHGR